MGKKIAIICNYVLSPHRIGGMDRFFVAYDKALKDKGFQVDWFFTNYEPFEFYKNLTIRSSGTCNVEETFIEYSKTSGISYSFIVTHFTALCTHFYKQFKELNPKAFVTAVDHNPRPLKGFSFKKRIKKRIEGIRYSKYIDQFIGVSKYTVHHLLNDYGKHLGKKTQVVYNGIDTSVFKKRTKNKENNWIVASHLRESKGIQDLIMALSHMPKELLGREQVKIDIYGEGPYEETLKKMVSRYQLKGIIEFKGSSPFLHQLFANYSYMIQPTYMECFSLSILESLSANVPVITTTVGGNLEVLIDGVNGFIYSPGDVEQLKKILIDIIEDKKKIEKDTSILIEEQYFLQKMVAEHIKILPCK